MRSVLLRKTNPSTRKRTSRVAAEVILSEDDEVLLELMQQDAEARRACGRISAAGRAFARLIARRSGESLRTVVPESAAIFLLWY